MELTKTSGIKVTFGPITVDKVSEGLNKDKKHQVQLRQLVRHEYPGVRAGNSLNDKLFEESEFDAKSQVFEEARVVFLPIPIGKSAEEVTTRLSQFKNARLIKILSLQPIISAEQRNAMITGLTKKTDGSPMTIADYAEKQAIRNKEGHKVYFKDQYEQYRVVSFMDGQSGPVEDIDTRETDLLDMFPIHMTTQESVSKTVEEAKAKF